MYGTEPWILSNLLKMPLTYTGFNAICHSETAFSELVW